ncbi:MAG: hypothetical protein AAF078_03425 [Planctomycetota bacterium]
MERRERRLTILGWSIALVLILAVVAAVNRWGAQAGPSLFIDFMAPGLISDESWRRSIEQDPTAHGYSAYGILKDRGSRAAVVEATNDLNHSDPYVWFNAALYLGSLDETDSVPYLIKGLRHPARRAYPEIVSALQGMTGQTYGQSQVDWVKWWETTHPNSTFEFTMTP